MNQEVPSAVARQRGFVVGPSFAGITVQFFCGSMSWCFVPYLFVGLRDESMHWYRFAALTPYTHIPDFCPPPVGGNAALILALVFRTTTELDSHKYWCWRSELWSDRFKLLLLCLIFPTLSEATPNQNPVLLLNSKCSYEFLVLDSLSPKRGYFFLIIRTNKGFIFRQAPRIVTLVSGSLVTVGVSW